MTLKSCEGNKSNDAEDTKYGQQTVYSLKKNTILSIHFKDSNIVVCV